MPTLRIAEKSAALEGVKKLHKIGELDRYLKPVSKGGEDSDEEDEAKVEERKINHAGTEKRGQNYRNEVLGTVEGYWGLDYGLQKLPSCTSCH